MPGFKDSELRKNEYKLYYKPYSLWKQECQKDGLLASDVIAQGQNIKYLQGEISGLQILTVVLYIIHVVYLPFACISPPTKASYNFNPCADITATIMFIIETIILGFIMRGFSTAKSAIMIIDSHLLSSFSYGHCSDAVLQHSLDMYVQEFDKAVGNLSKGSSFALFCMIVWILAFILSTNARELFIACIPNLAKFLKKKNTTAD